MILPLITFSFFRFHAVVGQYNNGSQRHKKVVRTPVTHLAVLSVPLVCSYHIWPHLWSTTEKTLSNMESFVE